MLITTRSIKIITGITSDDRFKVDETVETIFVPENDEDCEALNDFVTQRKHIDDVEDEADAA